MHEHDGTPPHWPPPARRPAPATRRRRAGVHALTCAGALLLLAAVMPVSGGAQATLEVRRADPAGVNDLALVAVNGVVAGLTAGIQQRMGGGSFRDGFVRGVAGGAIMYGGKRLTGEEFAMSRLLGRQVHALGSAVVHNAARERGTLERLFVPFGPLALELDRSGGGVATGVSVALYDLIRIGFAVAEPDLRWNWRESLRSGATVFDADNGALLDRGAIGAATGGVIFVEAPASPLRERVLDHEMTHVLQLDFMNRLWFDPIERRGVRAVLGAEARAQAIRPTLALPLTRAGLAGLGWLGALDRPLEIEAGWVDSAARR